MEEELVCDSSQEVASVTELCSWKASPLGGTLSLFSYNAAIFLSVIVAVLCPNVLYVDT